MRTWARANTLISPIISDTTTTTFESHCVPLSYGLVPHLSKKLSKFNNNNNNNNNSET